MSQLYTLRRPKEWSFSFRISSSSEYSGLISFRIDWLGLLDAQRTLKSLLVSCKVKPYLSGAERAFLSSVHSEKVGSIGISIRSCSLWYYLEASRLLFFSSL